MFIWTRSSWLGERGWWARVQLASVQALTSRGDMEEDVGDVETLRWIRLRGTTTEAVIKTVAGTRTHQGT
jgi:hypothetical protein